VLLITPVLYIITQCEKNHRNRTLINQVPTLPKVINNFLLIIVTYSFYMFVTFTNIFG
jgi:hypothetical protein